MSPTFNPKYTYTWTHAHTRARAHTHTHTRPLSLSHTHTHTEEASLRRMGLNSRGRRQASATVVYKRAYPSVCVWHKSASVSIRQHTSAASICNCCIQARISVCVCLCSMRQHPSASVSGKHLQLSYTIAHIHASHTHLTVRSSRCLPLTYADVC